jgi:Ser/Thr protein kinase RdoA (MazF antagonist)
MTSLAGVVRAFGPEPRAIRLISRRHNAHWKVLTTDGRDLILRCFGEQPDLDESAAWEAAALGSLAAAGLKVAAPLAPPRRLGGRLFGLYPHLAGRPLTSARRLAKLVGSEPMQAFYRELGRCLADYHAGAAAVPLPGQRVGWCEMADAHLPQSGGHAMRQALLARLEAADADAAKALRAAAETLERRNLAALFAGASRLIVHGDFSPWNILIRRGAVSGLLDFELAHVDVAAADVAFARRGSHDAAVWGYLERASLPDDQLAALDGLWTGIVLFGAWTALSRWPQGAPYDPLMLDWNLAQLKKTRPYARF